MREQKNLAAFEKSNEDRLQPQNSKKIVGGVTPGERTWWDPSHPFKKGKHETKKYSRDNNSPVSRPRAWQTQLVHDYTNIQD